MECCKCSSRTVAIIFTIIWVVKAIYSIWDANNGLNILPNDPPPKYASLRAIFQTFIVCGIIEFMLCAAVLFGIWQQKAKLLLPIIAWRAVRCLVMVSIGIKLYTLELLSVEITRDILFDIVSSIVGCFYIYIHHRELVYDPDWSSLSNRRQGYEAI
jgi:hypothetical protein